MDECTPTGNDPEVRRASLRFDFTVRNPNQKFELQVAVRPVSAGDVRLLLLCLEQKEQLAKEQEDTIAK